jgi:hypothetical protein
LIMILRGLNNIRDVIAFPKTQSGADLMCGAPAPVDEKQLREVHVKLNLPPGKAPSTAGEKDIHAVVHKHPETEAKTS